MSEGASLDARSEWRTSKNVVFRPGRSTLAWAGPFDDVRTKGIGEIELFLEFLELAPPATPAEQFVKFGRTYGPLHLCEHGLPKTHLPAHLKPFINPRDEESHSMFVAFSRHVIEEDLGAWRTLAGQAGAMVTINEQIRGRRPTAPSRVEWQQIEPLLPDVPTVSGERFYDYDEGPEAHRRWLKLAVGRWLEWSDIGFSVKWNGNGAKATSLTGRLGASSLFGTLALGLALTVTGSSEIRICAGCGRPFPTLRRRDPDKRAWCSSNECLLIRRKLEVRRFRARERASRASIDQP